MNTYLLLPALLALALQQGPTPSGPRAGTATSAGSSVDSSVAGDAVPDILAAAWSTNSVVRFDGRTGQYEGNFTVGGELRLPSGLDFGPDGHLYVASFYWDTVLKYDGETGLYLETFVPGGSGGLNQPGQIEFRPNGFLYVLASYDGGVMRFDARTGAFHDVFIPSGSGGITLAFAMTFGPDGDIYLGGYYAKTVVRFDGQTGAVKGVVAGYVDTPMGLTFDPDGNVLVGEWRTGTFLQHNIQRYTPDGQFLGKLVDLAQGPLDLELDDHGRLYVAGESSIDILDGRTGEWIDILHHPGIEDQMAITFTPGLRARVLR